MSSPPYSRENPQRPLFTEELRINWSGTPLKNKPFYVIKAGCADNLDKLSKLQEKLGVIDFPNILDDKMDKLPKERDDKNKLIKQAVRIVDDPKYKSESVRQFINRVTSSGGVRYWDTNVYVPED